MDVRRREHHQNLVQRGYHSLLRSAMGASSRCSKMRAAFMPPALNLFPCSNNFHKLTRENPVFTVLGVRHGQAVRFMPTAQHENGKMRLIFVGHSMAAGAYALHMQARWTGEELILFCMVPNGLPRC